MAASSQTYCSEQKQCVTGSGNWKLYFSSGIQLTVEKSKCATTIINNHNLFGWFILAGWCKMEKTTTTTTTCNNIKDVL